MEYAYFIHSACVVGKLLCFTNGRKFFPIKLRDTDGKKINICTWALFINDVYGKCPKIFDTEVSDKMVYADMLDPHQTAPEGESDQGLHFLPLETTALKAT